MENRINLKINVRKNKRKRNVSNLKINNEQTFEHCILVNSRGIRLF
jgi:hypothetical protein